MEARPKGQRNPVSIGSLAVFRARKPHQAEGTADHADHGQHQHLVLVLQGWNIEAIESAVGYESANEEDREIQRKSHIAEIPREFAQNDGTNRAEQNAGDQDFCRHSHVGDIVDKGRDIDLGQSIKHFFLSRADEGRLNIMTLVTLKTNEELRMG
jgi:hypothetical protein